MLNWIDNILNRITMYRLVLYYLAALIGAAFIFGTIGIMPQDPAALGFSLIVITGTCWIANWVMARVWRAATNVESIYITAFILTLIIPPAVPSNPAGVGFLVFVSVWAMASKYMFALGKRHLFNPAAFGAALSAIVIGQSATWWVAGNLQLLPLVLAGGLLVVRKIKRTDLVLSFSAAALISAIMTATGGGAATTIIQVLLRSSFFFFAFVMLTEPLTTPPTRPLRIAYGTIVGLLFAPNAHIGSFYFSPELALLSGNIFSYIVSPKGRYTLTLTGIEETARDTYDFVFAPDRKFQFAPGQYMEWTLPHPYSDNRGNRRYFTLASAPTEKEVRLGVKFYPQASTFKRALSAMKSGDELSVAHLSGGFTMPKDPERKLVFIAGGIGITPFRSMVQYLMDKGVRRDIAVFYSNKTAADIAYKSVFDRAASELGIKTVYVLTDEKNAIPGAYNGQLDAKLIAREVPDYRDRTFYISGPHAMVKAFQDSLREIGVSRFKIKSDFFPGYA